MPNYYGITSKRVLALILVPTIIFLAVNDLVRVVTQTWANRHLRAWRRAQLPLQEGSSVRPSVRSNLFFLLFCAGDRSKIYTAGAIFFNKRQVLFKRNYKIRKRNQRPASISIARTTLLPACFSAQRQTSLAGSSTHVAYPLCHPQRQIWHH